MARQSENILRRGNSTKAMIITFSIMLFILFLLVSYGYYCVLCYQTSNNITDMEMEDYILAISSMSKFQFDIPISSVLGQILMFQLSVWWLYVGIALLLFIFITNRNRNDFKNMEHGSALRTTVLSTD